MLNDTNAETAVKKPILAVNLTKEEFNNSWMDFTNEISSESNNK